MKLIKSLAFVAITCLSFTLLSLAPADAGPNVSIKKGNIKINGVTVTSDWSLASFKKALGEPDRTRDGYNKTHTYDSKNTVLFEPMANSKPSGKISEVQFHFHIASPNEVTPTGSTFPGTLKVDKLTVTRDLSATAMLAKLKKWEKTDSYIEHSYRMASLGLYIYFQFNNDETKLEKISIGPDKNYTGKK